MRIAWGFAGCGLWAAGFRFPTGLPSLMLAGLKTGCVYAASG